MPAAPFLLPQAQLRTYEWRDLGSRSIDIVDDRTIALKWRQVSCIDKACLVMESN